MAVDTGIIKIYDLLNGGEPLTCHRIDARSFLAHPSGRWSASPKAVEKSVAPSSGAETGEDTGEEMRLKAMHFKTLQAAAKKEGIPGAESMDRAGLVNAMMEKAKV